MRKALVVVATLGLLASAVSPARAVVVFDPVDWGTTNSWFQGFTFGSGYPGGFDEVQWHYRADLDPSGLNTFDPPFASNMRVNNVIDPSWSVWGGSSSTMVAITGAYSGIPDTFRWQQHFAGNRNDQSGWNLVLYKDQQWLEAYELIFDGNGSSTGGPILTRRSSDFNPGSVVPEPGSFLLLALAGGLGLAARKLRRR